MEREILEAMGRGEFDRLPGIGQPIPGIDGDDLPDWWARQRIARERALEKSLATAALVQRALPHLWTLPDPSAVDEAVRNLNRLLEEANRRLPEHERLDVLDPAIVLADWRRMHRARTGLGEWQGSARRGWALGRTAHSPGSWPPIQ